MYDGYMPYEGPDETMVRWQILAWGVVLRQCAGCDQSEKWMSRWAWWTTGEEASELPVGT